MRMVLPWPTIRPSAEAVKLSRSKAILRPARAPRRVPNTGDDVVERGGDGRSFRHAIVLAQRTLHAIYDGLRYLTEVGVARPVLVEQAGLRNVFEVVGHGGPPQVLRRVRSVAS